MVETRESGSRVSQPEQALWTFFFYFLSAIGRHFEQNVSQFIR